MCHGPYLRVTGFCFYVLSPLSLSLCHEEGVEDPWPSLYMLWLGSDQSFPSTGTLTGGASRQLAFPVKIMFAYCLSLPSATPHKGDSLILVCSEPSQG